MQLHLNKPGIGKLVSLVMISLVVSLSANASDILPDGTYKFTYGFEEYTGRDLDTTCTVIIKGKSVKIIHDGSKRLKGAKGKILDQGILVKHKRTGKWIIGKSAKDALAPEVGGCVDGPNIIDLKKKIYWSC